MAFTILEVSFVFTGLASVNIERPVKVFGGTFDLIHTSVCDFAFMMIFRRVVVALCL